MAQAHSQKDELNFIQAIADGKNSMSTDRTMGQRMDALKGYIAGCEKRVDWRGLDKEECIECAKQHIARMSK